MNESYQDILTNILKNYFDKSQIAEFNELLSRSYKVPPKYQEKIPTAEKKQLKSEISNKNFYPLFVDLIITFATDKLLKPKLIELMLYLGETCIAQGELEIASQIYIQILSKINADKMLENIAAHSLLALGEICSRQAQWENSIDNINNAKRLFNKQKDIKGIAKCNNMLGTIYGDRGNIKKAKECFENSLSFLNRSTDTVMIGMIETNLGILNSIKGDYDESLVYYQRALIKYDKIKDVMRISQLRHNLGMLHTQKAEYASALIEFDLSIAIAINSGFLPNLALSYLSKAYVYVKTDDLPLAIAFADKSLNLCRKLNDRLSIADIYKIKGMIERKLKHFDLSENYFLTSLRLNEELENLLNHAETLFELGDLYFELKRKDDAIKYLKTSLNDYKKIGADLHVKRVAEYIKNLSL